MQTFQINTALFPLTHHGLSVLDSLQVTYYRDTYAEHPDDRVNIQYKVPLDNDQALVTLSGMYDQVKEETGANLEYSRQVMLMIPLRCEDFSILV